VQTPPQASEVVLISEMRGRIEDLREQVQAERAAHAEARRIIAGLIERLPPQLEEPSDERESPVTDDSPGPRERPFTEEERPMTERSWWRRVFGR
jgi:hypothetical protein